MQTAADAAGIAALSQKSPGFLAASVMTGNGSVTAGVTDANNVFDANMSGITGYQNLVRSSTVTKTGIKLAATVTYTCRCTGILPESDRVSETDGNGRFKFGRHVAAVSRFLSDAGRLGVDGPAVDRRRADAACARSIRITVVQYRNAPASAAPWPAILRRKTAPASIPLSLPLPLRRQSRYTSSHTQQYNTNAIAWAISISRVSQTALNNLINQNVDAAHPKQKPGLPATMLPT